ncbi:MAG TPA: hypothetical protein VG297_12230 [Bryobacteraceae bacterium]|jgi:uncharacterized protein (TIGR03437 family)|nr:hypothetical protein [Bryobacteraceae bacterium]
MGLCLRFFGVTCLAGGLLAQDVLTGGYDTARTNADPNEALLTPLTVSPNQFGKLFLLPADGQIYAQPLYQHNVAIAGQGIHNVVFIATAHNTVYCYDADTAAAPIWTVNLGPSVPSSSYTSDQGAYTDITPEIGIIGTPVIDAATGTLYVVAATLEGGTYYYRLHALDTGSGNERFGAPAAINAQVKGFAPDSVDGVVRFDPLQHIQRPALLLSNGVVYIAFGSHGDALPWHGWIMGYNAADVRQQAAVFNSSPNGWGGSLWNSGRGLSTDAQGNIYAVTANGDTDDTSDYGDSMLRLNPGDLTVADWFAPADVQTLDNTDDDLGSAGAIVVPGTNLIVTGGKEGVMYLLDAGALGNMGGSQESFQPVDFGLFNMALWSRSSGPVLFLHGANGQIGAYPFAGNQIQTTASSESSDSFGVPFDGMIVSANGGAAGSGILWVTTADSYPLPATGTLHAWNADDLSSELWNSSINADRDSLGGFSKFANPTVANGKVYVPTTSNALAVYGAIAPAGGGGAMPVISGVVNAASYAQGSLAPGEIVAVFGQNLGPQQLALGTFDSNGNLETGINGMSITFNGVPAPMLYASAFTLAAVVPFEVSAANQADVQVSADGTASAIQTFNVAPAAPGIFTGDASGKGQAAVVNQDSSLNSDANPAPAGSVISVYATGGGQTDPPDSTGATAEGIARLPGPVTATIGGQPAQVIYAGHAPGEVAGMLQVNLQVPDGVSGDVPVVLWMGDAESQTTATAAVK